MPLFVYTCNRCNHLFEKVVGRRDPIPKCPACDSEDVRVMPDSADRLRRELIELCTCAA